MCTTHRCRDQECLHLQTSGPLCNRLCKTHGADRCLGYHGAVFVVLKAREIRHSHVNACTSQQSVPIIATQLIDTHVNPSAHQLVANSAPAGLRPSVPTKTNILENIAASGTLSWCLVQNIVAISAAIEDELWTWISAVGHQQPKVASDPGKLHCIIVRDIGTSGFAY